MKIKIGKKRSHPVFLSGGAQHVQCEALCDQAKQKQQPARRCKMLGVHGFNLDGGHVLFVCWSHARMGMQRGELEVVG